MNTLQYKDYHGAVFFEDGRLVIQVLHIDDTVTTECDKASEAQSAFEDLVEDYIETCLVVGKEPNRPFKGTFNVRIGPDLHRKAVVAATQAGIALNAWIAGAVSQRLNREHFLQHLHASSLARELASAVPQRTGSMYQYKRLLQHEQRVVAKDPERVRRLILSEANSAPWRSAH